MEPADRPPGSQEVGQPQRREAIHPAYEGFADVGFRINLIAYHDALVASAEQWIQQGQYNVGVIFLETACEIATEQLFDRLLERRQAEWVKDTGLLRDFAITNGRVRNVYETLTGDKLIAQAPFWNHLQASSDIRNKVIHGHYEVTKEEAEEALKAVRDLIERLTVTADDLGIKLT